MLIRIYKKWWMRIQIWIINSKLNSNLVLNVKKFFFSKIYLNRLLHKFEFPVKKNTKICWLNSAFPFILYLNECGSIRIHITAFLTKLVFFISFYIFFSDHSFLVNVCLPSFLNTASLLSSFNSSFFPYIFKRIPSFLWSLGIFFYTIYEKN